MPTRRKEHPLRWFLEGLGVSLSGLSFQYRDDDSEPSDGEAQQFEVDGSDAFERAEQSIGQAVREVGRQLDESIKQVDPPEGHAVK